VKADEVRELFAYNTWATRRIFEALASLPPGDYTRDLKSSFASIHATLAHIVGADRIWLARWRGESGVGMLKGEDVPSLAELRKLWEKVEAERTQFLAGLQDDDLTREIVVKPSGGGQQYVHRLLETLQHAVDHSSYHRGQIVTMMRQVNVKPPSTGLIGYYREKSSKAA